jgi:hypothetical protein
MRLVDIDKVKKNLDENKPDWTAEDYAVACEDAEFYSSMEDFIAEHDDEIEMMMFAPELVPDEPKWIPCSERLPEKHVEVLAYSPYWGKIVVAMWGGEFWLEQWTDDDLEQSEITHWMPLPEPPEGGTDDG